MKSGSMVLRYSDTSHIAHDELQSTAVSLAPYLRQLRQAPATGVYIAPECSINLATDQELLKIVLAAKRKLVTASLRYLIVIGIGGSNLGAKAVYDALYGYFDALRPKRFPKMIFLDTCDPEFLSHLKKFLQTEIKKSQEVLVNVISKSGTTTESAVNAEVVLQTLGKRFPKVGERIVVTTDKDSKLWQLARQKNFTLLEIPKQVGGRYSVLSAVGLFPLAVVGINVNALRTGALKMREGCLGDGMENPALVSACVLYLQHQQGKAIHDTFVFHPELESLGKWYRQLMGESIGKEKDADGKTVNTGIFPSVSVGSTDLHSVGQLYLGGQQNIVTTFVAAKNYLRIKIPEKLQFFGLVNGITGKTTSDVISAILEGVKIAYTKRGLPFMEIVLDDLSERSLGEFLQFKMMEMMYLGKLFNVNAFDQPNVESYKIETRKILLTH